MNNIIEINGIKYKDDFISNLKARKRQWVIDNENFDPENESECIEAVKKYSNAIEHINNPSENIQLEAVKQDGLAIQYIKNPSENVIKEALNKNPDYFIYIKF